MSASATGIATALDRVGPRLQRLRARRGMRLILGNRDLMLEPGEAVEFDTQPAGQDAGHG